MPFQLLLIGPLLVPVWAAGLWRLARDPELRLYRASRRCPASRSNAADPGYTATDLNGPSGYQTVEQGAEAIVRLATIGPDGPTGSYIDAHGPFRGDVVPCRLDGELVRRPRRTGVITLGRTNTAEFGVLPTTEPDLREPTRNP